MRRSITISVIVALSILAAATFLWSGQAALALEPGVTVQFLLPAAGDQPEPNSGPAQDRLIYTGGLIAAIDTTGCVAGTFPAQYAVLVDPSGGRASRVAGVITVFQSGGGTDPVPPGTRVTNILFVGDCVVGGSAYVRYQGTVD